ncbi:hypothetical protein [Cupriavidus sp. H39]|uniref:hypothetical protein n=1 Tax=Cupriavidus sp. H39 TaxID=3401635 RepID=UPI003CFD5E21
MKRRHAILSVGLLSAGAIAAFGDRTSVNGVATAVDRGRSSKGATPIAESRPAQSPPGGLAGEQAPAILALRPRGSPSDKGPPSAGDEIFASQTWVPPPPLPPPAPKPTAPPLPFVYLGKQQQQGIWIVFLGRDSETYVVKSADPIGEAYRVETISPPTMTLKYLPLNESQTLTIE